jgi:hypothetical protein
MEAATFIYFELVTKLERGGRLGARLSSPWSSCASHEK